MDEEREQEPDFGEAPEEESDPFYEVKERLDQGDLSGAQAKLDEFDERGGEWHYVQSLVYRKQNWIAECRKSLERALSFEPGNETYQKEMAALDEMAQSGKKARKKKKGPRAMGEQIGWNACIDGGCECCALVCCESICEWLSGC